MSDDRIIGVIPARGGSKGIPRKNVRLLAGKPLIAHTIDAAKQSRYLERIVVSTDDAEIAAISQSFGAEVIWRPQDISGDLASSELALLHALDHLRLTEAYEPNLLVFLQCTSPLTLPNDIDATVNVLQENNADSALAVTLFHYFLWKQDTNGNALGINHDKYERPLRQQRPPQYRETGAVYAMRTQGFIAAKHRFFGKTAMYVMPPERCFEIDSPVDLHVADVLLREQQKHCQLNQLPNPVEALILDFDGVFTDNTVLVGQDGHEAVTCCRSDGLGLARLKTAGLPIVVVSTEHNPVVAARCTKLGLPFKQGVQDKAAFLRDWLARHNISHNKAVYVGNDLNDLAPMMLVGCSVAVSDAHPRIITAARIVLSHRGGHGAIRELCDLIFTQMHKETTY